MIAAEYKLVPFFLFLKNNSEVIKKDRTTRRNKEKGRESGKKTKTPQKKLEDGLKTEGGNKKKKKTIRRLGENKAKSERYYTPGKGIIEHKTTSFMHDFGRDLGSNSNDGQALTANKPVLKSLRSWKEDSGRKERVEED